MASIRMAMRGRRFAGLLLCRVVVLDIFCQTTHVTSNYVMVFLDSDQQINIAKDYFEAEPGRLRDIENPGVSKIDIPQE